MTGERMRRVDEAMREVLSDAITSEIKDPRVGFVTVTAVETSADLRHARVYVSVLGEGAVRRRSMAGLESAHGFLQRRVAGELRLKNTPTLDFVYDDSTDRGMRIAQLLEDEGVRGEAGEASAGGEGSGRDRKRSEAG
jgi:ribosome-binding factor A